METFESPRLTFNRENGKRVLKVFGWTVAAAFIGLLLDSVDLLELPTEYAFVVPLVNTILYAMKEFVTAQSNQ